MKLVLGLRRMKKSEHFDNILYNNLKEFASFCVFSYNDKGCLHPFNSQSSFGGGLMKVIAFNANDANFSKIIREIRTFAAFALKKHPFRNP